jgi:predicted anti-sigma-YlaC factor YlaD
MEERRAIAVAGGQEQPREVVHSCRRYWGNSKMLPVDYPSMNCTQIRQAISARLDGEPLGIDRATLDAHLASCADCLAFATEAGELHRGVRLAAAPEIPDLTPGILAAIGAETSSGDTQLALRWILAVLAFVQIAVAVPALVLGADANLPVHTARHLGSFDVAIAVGFLFAAWRPSRIPGLLPVVAALVACLVGSSMLDVLAGNTAALTEAHHVTDFAGLVVVWLLNRPVARPVQLA